MFVKAARTARWRVDEKGLRGPGGGAWGPEKAELGPPGTWQRLDQGENQVDSAWILKGEDAGLLRGGMRDDRHRGSPLQPELLEGHADMNGAWEMTRGPWSGSWMPRLEFGVRPSLG